VQPPGRTTTTQPGSQNLSQNHLLSKFTRQANAALHRIVVDRLGRDPETRAYMAAHLNANGSNKMHVMPILKRYVVRRLYPADQPGSAKP